MTDRYLKDIREALNYIERKIKDSEFNDSDMYHTINNARIAIDEIEKSQSINFPSVLIYSLLVGHNVGVCVDQAFSLNEHIHFVVCI